MTSPEKLATPESLRELTERLSRLAVGTVEWRVADPETRAYCIAFTRREELDPENAAREWLKKHIAEFPRSPHANKVVVQVRCFSELERAALEAVAALRLATQRQGEGETRDAALEQAANLVECEYAADATQGRRLAQIAQHIRDLKKRKPL